MKAPFSLDLFSTGRHVARCIAFFTTLLLLAGAAHAGPVSACAWSSGFHSPGPSADVYASTIFDDGSGPALYIGGFFRTIDNVAANYVAKWDGAGWSPVGDGPDGGVLSLIAHDDGSGPALYASGSFGDQSFKRWDGQTWSAVGSPDIDGVANAMAVYDDGTGLKLFAAGSLELPSTGFGDEVLRWDGQAWSSVGRHLSGRAEALATFDDGMGSKLYVGGWFDSLETAGEHLASWDGQTWSSVGTGIDGPVFALAEYEDQLFASGPFFDAGGVAVSNVARWNGTAWSRPGGLANAPLALAVYDDGSGPVLAGGITAGSGGITAWDGSTWAELATGSAGLEAWTLSVFDDGSGPRLFAAGRATFPFTDQSPSASLLAFDGTSWALPVPWAQARGALDEVYAMTSFDDGRGAAIYAGGYFEAIGGANTALGRWDGAQWQPVPGMPTARVLALRSLDDGNGSALFVGGMNIALRWDGQAWTILDTMTWDVHDFAAFDGGSGPELYAAADDPGIQRWNGSHWEDVGSGLNGAAQTLVTFDDGSGPALYVGGTFGSAGGQATGGLARWDGATWSAVGAIDIDRVRALHIFDDGNGAALYAGGRFFDVGSPGASYVVKWDGAAWQAVGDLDGEVLALTSFDDGSGPQLYAGGEFTSALARWTGTAWQAVDSGTNDTVRALAGFDGPNGPSLMVGGDFDQVGDGLVSTYIGRYACGTQNVIFASSFESGDLSAWSSTTPRAS